MTSLNLVMRSLRFYWRNHLGVVLGVAISTAILLGALVVGDSVRYSLKQIAISRLGKIQLALNSQDRLFRAEISDDLENQLGYNTVPVLMLKGIAINDENTARANNIQVFGVDERFWKLRDEEPSNIKFQGDSAIINERLAKQISASSGDEILLKVEKLDLFPRDAPMSLDTDLSVAFRVKIDSVTPDLDIGGFSFQSNQIAPFNVFVPIDLLQEKISQKGRANILLVGDKKNNDSKSVCTVENANAALRNNWKLADAGLELQTLPEQNMIQLSTGRIFIDPQIASIAKQSSSDSIEVLTYFVNEIRLGDKATPYSIVTAIDPKYFKFSNPPNSLFQRGNTSISPFSKGGKGDLKRNQFIPHPSSSIIINSWLADDLSAKVGDIIQLKYYVFQNSRKLEQKTSSFRISAIVPIQGFANDRTLMPEFPGLANVQNCRDWEPGMPIDLDKIRDKDQSYWDTYRGTPKAFISLKDGQAIWGNRFGNLTAIRYPIDRNYKSLNPPLSPFSKGGKFGSPLWKRGVRGDLKSFSSQEKLIQLTNNIIKKIDPTSIGLFFQPIRQQALSASKPTTDFGQLFLGLSFFLIISAILLTGLLFVFGIQQRREEIGTLLALGFRANLTQRLFLSEGIILAVFGSIIGAGIGIFYTKIVLYALSTIWKGAVAGTSLRYHAEPITFLSGILAGVVISSITIWVTLRRQTRLSARELLSSGSGVELYKKGKSNLSLWLTIVVFIISIIILILASSTGAFFGAGTLMLLGCFGLSYWILSTLTDSKGTKHLTLRKIGFRNIIRNRGRSLAIIMLLACGSFLVIAIGANRHDPMKDMGNRSSGTGGFTFYAESTLPVLQNLNDEKERMKYGSVLPLHGIYTPDMQDINFVQIRVHEGSDASCLNLNRVYNPRLLGVNPDELQKRGSFTFAKSLSSDGFLMLKDKPTSSNVRTINAIGDNATITWGLGLSVDDTIAYTDEKGQNFQIRIVGALANSILQGSFLISEENFITLFPSESGYHTFLIDAPLDKIKDISKELSRSFRDVGMELTPTSTRLAEFNAVQNTYLYIFQMLGGLALILGSVGLGIVVLRNVMERRSELALLRAVGFGKRSILWFLLSEHWALLLMGEIFGTITGLIAVLPSITSSGTGIPYVSLIVTMIAVFISGLIWTWLATKLALRSELLPALRNE